MSCPGCDTSSTTYTRCNPPVSTNCVFYQGKSLECKIDPSFNICNGQSMSQVQETIFEKVCDLTGAIDVTNIQFPCSLYGSWFSTKPQNKTLNLLLQGIVDLECEITKQITDILSDIKTLDPIVNVCLQCCDTSACGTTEMLVSEAINKIAQCACNAKTVAEDALEIADKALAKAQAVSNAYKDLWIQYCKLNAQVTQIAIYLNANNIGPGIALTTNCPSPPPSGLI